MVRGEINIWNTNVICGRTTLSFKYHSITEEQVNIIILPTGRIMVLTMSKVKESSDYFQSSQGLGALYIW